MWPLNKRKAKLELLNGIIKTYLSWPTHLGFPCFVGQSERVLSFNHSQILVCLWQAPLLGSRFQILASSHFQTLCLGCFANYNAQDLNFWLCFLPLQLLWVNWHSSVLRPSVHYGLVTNGPSFWGSTVLSPECTQPGQYSPNQLHSFSRLKNNSTQHWKQRNQELSGFLFIHSVNQLILTHDFTDFPVLGLWPQSQIRNRVSLLQLLFSQDACLTEL